MRSATAYNSRYTDVINDRKIYNSTDQNYDPVLLSWSDYYAFGMTMPGRNGGVGYRYQFNGMETDNEISGSGNSYTTEFRQYDPRLGRWKSLDPLMSKFHHISPYVGFANNPIYFVDPYGLEPVNDGGGDPPTCVEPPPTQKRGEDGNMTDWENGDTWVGKGENGEYIQYTYVKGENGANDKWTYGKINVGSETVINGKSTQPAKMDQKIRIEIQKDLFFDVTYGDRLPHQFITRVEEIIIDYDVDYINEMGKWEASDSGLRESEDGEPGGRPGDYEVISFRQRKEKTKKPQKNGPVFEKMDIIILEEEKVDSIPFKVHNKDGTWQWYKIHKDSAESRGTKYIGGGAAPTNSPYD